MVHICFRILEIFEHYIVIQEKNTELFKRRWALCKSTMLLCISTSLFQWQIFRGNIIMSYVCTAVDCFHVILKWNLDPSTDPVRTARFLAVEER